jgi:hypothetical protein
MSSERTANRGAKAKAAKYFLMPESPFSNSFTGSSLGAMLPRDPAKKSPAEAARADASPDVHHQRHMPERRVMRRNRDPCFQQRSNFYENSGN